MHEKSSDRSLPVPVELRTPSLSINSVVSAVAGSAAGSCQAGVRRMAYHDPPALPRMARLWYEHWIHRKALGASRGALPFWQRHAVYYGVDVVETNAVTRIFLCWICGGGARINQRRCPCVAAAFGQTITPSISFAQCVIYRFIFPLYNALFIALYFLCTMRYLPIGSARMTSTQPRRGSTLTTSTLRG
jgi:hypothetical protein